MQKTERKQLLKMYTPCPNGPSVHRIPGNIQEQISNRLKMQDDDKLVYNVSRISDKVSLQRYITLCAT